MGRVVPTFLGLLLIEGEVTTNLRVSRSFGPSPATTIFKIERAKFGGGIV